ncbi:MAG: NADH-quinone oxidoreductase subunit NuoE [Thermanaeromonas sp.]|uniref:NADH-quinone oxidoreductase subunit NuoE n=1 Tax=Thermanaeromonas sp. TaxID=2003697 RepID=UPI00243D07A3|nr:NADH-quinone oxidoreductase subunit NuoE [Thermanaeromonas sp.]MCG0277479.1 NADH-quinone oxidoreductase subunit NuoE [Thermanaeromonas sp.]
MEACKCEEKWEQLNEIIKAHRGQPSSLIEVLHKAQELIGYLPKQVLIAIAEGLGVSLSEVYSVVSFYAYFTTKPKGKYQISLCKGTACYVKGAPEILERLEKELGIKAGDSTDDGRFSLEVVRCLGACGLAPVMMVNKRAYGLLRPDKAVAVLQTYQ